MKIVINIDVPELRPAIAFYTAALGLTHSRTLDDAELTGASATLYLLQKKSGTAAVKTPPVDRDYRRHWTPVHFDLVVPDVDAAAASVSSSSNTVERTLTRENGPRASPLTRAPVTLNRAASLSS